MYKLPTLQELLEAGVHFGHQVRRGHPRMKHFIFGAKDGVHIIDLTKAEPYLKTACEYVYELGKNGKVLLFVGTKKQARPIVEEAAKKLNSPYMTFRWMGGFLTNFEEIKKRIKLLKDLKAAKEKGELAAKYTKKEQLLLDRKMEKLQHDFSGVMEMSVMPDALFVIDAVTDNIAVKEANRLGIPVIAIADSNCNISEIDQPIPGNDDAIKSISILVTAVADAYEVGKKEAGEAEAKRVEKEAKDEEKRKADEVKMKVKVESKEVEDKLDEQLVEEVAAAEEIIEKKAVKDSERIVE